jgi:hypothetical protein
MKKLHLLTATAGILLALAGPSLAAQRVHRGADAYASGAGVDRSGAYNYGPVGGGAGYAQGGGYTPYQQSRQQFNAGQNLPYPDRPYGDPDRW